MTETSAKPLFWLDRRAKQLFKPYMHSAPVKAIDKAAEIGDQPQMRLLCAGLVAAGLLGAKPRMVRAGVRMLLAHELATYVKGLGKDNVDRKRPRSTSGRKASHPHKGDSDEKELQSFPSGHSAGGVAAACAFASVYPEYRAPALAAGGAVALAQIATCAHYPSDVAAGATIGAASNGALSLAWKAVKGVAMAVLR
jgi:membrane-associated phospholipid phosphatase